MLPASPPPSTERTPYYPPVHPRVQLWSHFSPLVSWRCRRQRRFRNLCGSCRRWGGKPWYSYGWCRQLPHPSASVPNFVLTVLFSIRQSDKHETKHLKRFWSEKNDECLLLTEHKDSECQREHLSVKTQGRQRKTEGDRHWWSGAYWHWLWTMPMTIVKERTEFCSNVDMRDPKATHPRKLPSTSSSIMVYIRFTERLPWILSIAIARTNSS